MSTRTAAWPQCGYPNRPTARLCADCLAPLRREASRRAMSAAVGLRKIEIGETISNIPDQIGGWLDDNLWGSGPRYRGAYHEVKSCRSNIHTAMPVSAAIHTPSARIDMARLGSSVMAGEVAAACPCTIHARMFSTA